MAASYRARGPATSEGSASRSGQRAARARLRRTSSGSSRRASRSGPPSSSPRSSSRSASSATRNPGPSPTASCCSRRIRSPSPWKVVTSIRRASPGTRSSSRSWSSAAARRVKVIARHRSAGMARSSTRCASRWVSVRVFPVPGPATTSSGPGPAPAAPRCSGSNPPSTPATGSSVGGGGVWTTPPARAGCGLPSRSGAPTTEGWGSGAAGIRAVGGWGSGVGSNNLAVVSSWRSSAGVKIRMVPYSPS
jgi:hypothetical protein